MATTKKKKETVKKKAKKTAKKAAKKTTKKKAAKKTAKKKAAKKTAKKKAAKKTAKKKAAKKTATKSSAKKTPAKRTGASTAKKTSRKSIKKVVKKLTEVVAAKKRKSKPNAKPERKASPTRKSAGSVKFDITSKVQRQKDVAWRLIDGEVVIVTPADSTMHTLNDVGTRIWELITGERTLAEVAQILCAEFEVDKQRAEKDTLWFVQCLAKKGLVEKSA